MYSYGDGKKQEAHHTSLVVSAPEHSPILDSSETLSLKRDAMPLFALGSAVPPDVLADKKLEPLLVIQS
jgi:hypothetical protein